MKKLFLIFVLLLGACSTLQEDDRQAFVKRVEGEYRILPEGAEDFNRYVYNIVNETTPGVITVDSNGMVTLGGRNFELEDITSVGWGVYSFEEDGKRWYFPINVSKDTEILFNHKNMYKFAVGNTNQGIRLTHYK